MSASEEYIAERKAAEDEQRRRLAAVDLDGPHEFHGSDMFSVLGGGGSLKFAICLKCGAMIRLDDPMERTDGPPVERGVKLHVEWHSVR